jgi:hypothetical protein
MLRYGAQSAGRFCYYQGGGGVSLVLPHVLPARNSIADDVKSQLTLEVGSYVDSSCRPTTINNGADPKPSGGGNFRKRQADIQAKREFFAQASPADLQLAQVSACAMPDSLAETTMICPLAPSNSLPLTGSFYLYYPNNSPPQDRIQCQ